ncbi:MAG: hypothetical protein J3R72DRAFT_424445 [Linnemannia gamsii]|nr:MAG: hypothetical protein J3R72DRAFT_424445 [Linnemannia gamsii]
MKFIFFVALSASVVSALPAINTILSPKEGYLNVFYFDIDYNNGQPNYYNVMFTEASPYDRQKISCYEDGVWCVKYFGFEVMTEEVTIQYAGRDWVHEPPFNNVKVGTRYRSTWVFEDCIPW